MEVVEDFESRPHKAVNFLVEKTKKSRTLRDLKMPKSYQDSVVENEEEAE